MRKKRVLFLAAVVVLMHCASACAATAEYSAGQPVSQPPQWPEGMAEVVNSPNRVYGFLYNTADFFFFRGDADDFNRFIERYAALKDIPLQLNLAPGRGKTTTFGNSGVEFDWTIAMSSWLEADKRVCSGMVTLLVGGEVELEKVKVPANVAVETNVQDKDSPVAKFIAARVAKQKESKETGEEAPRMDAQTGGIPGDKGGESREPATFKSGRVLYAKIALNEDASRILTVALDESGGTRTGYDLLYADTNFNGGFEESERLAAKDIKKEASWLSSSSFAPVGLDVPYNRKALGVSGPCQVTLGYRQYPRHGVAEELSVAAKVKLSDGGIVWEYCSTGGIKPSKRLEGAPVWRFAEKPSLEVTAQPDGAKKGNVGIGLKLAAGENKLECWRGGKAVEAHVEIKTPDAKVVHKGDATLDKFTFG